MDAAIISKLNTIVKSLQQGDLKCITPKSVIMINNATIDILNISGGNHTIDQITQMGLIIKISNILYNNTDRVILPLEDGIYDLLLVLYKGYNPNYLVGAEPIMFEASKNSSVIDIHRDDDLIIPVSFMDEDTVMNSLFIADDLCETPNLTEDDLLFSPVFFQSDISKRTKNTAHNYPELVGTLDKCKFVLNSDAKDRGVFEDNNVQVFERDFIQKHLSMGIIQPNERFTMVAELKYDGISVEADVSNRILSARSRGDTGNDLASDLTPILEGYRFSHANMLPDEEAFGMKFEAIITWHNLYRMNQKFGKTYKNCRNAIIGIFGSSDAYLYRDYITLVPLATSLHGINRIEEIEFMNKYYQTGEYLRYAVLEGTYVEILYQVARFLDEAEYMRPFMPFMYDGIVLSYLDENKREMLGRKNSVNLYSMAVKFSAMKKLTTFIGYDYSVGQNGTITPMIYYNPVEFYGTVHNKSTGHSYARFKELNLAIGDIVSVEYTNDVMPYVTKPMNENNDNNPNLPVEFITECPSCGNKLKLSDSGKTMYCDNISCPARNISRMVNMLQKLNLKDFSEESLKIVAKFSLYELFHLNKKDVEALGPNDSQLFIDRINEIKNNPIYDYKIVGALGFTGIAIEKWKTILNKIPLSDIINLDENTLREILLKIKGVGPSTVDVIITERDFFKNDLLVISTLPNLIFSQGIKSGKSIRYSGIRDEQLTEYLQSLGLDANEDAGVTKTTDILIVPNEGYTSTKTSKANANNGNTIIVPINDFKANIDKYIG